MTYAPPQRLEDIPSVDDLVAEADKTVAGLEKAKRRIALLLYRHMVAAFTGVYTSVPNLMIIGPSGGGKTHLVTTMLDACPIPWAEGNATEYSPSGFQGRDMPTMYAGLISPRWMGVKNVDETTLTQREMIDHGQRYGVILLDEIDKIRLIGGLASAEKDFGRPLQAELLKLTEGTIVEVRRFDGDRGFSFDTTRVLHIAVGAFEGLDAVMHKIDGINDPTPQDKLSVHLEVDAYDVIRYGFLPELVGRFASIFPLPHLDHAAMTRILVEHSVPAYQQSLASMERGLEVEPGGLSWIAGEATKSKVGARGITPLLEEILSEPWSRSKPGDCIAITAASVQRRTADLRSGGLAVAS